MKELYDKGEVYFNTVDFFKQCDNNKERFDIYENASEIDQITWLKIADEKGGFYQLSKEIGNGIHLSNANLITHDNTIKGNIFSCIGITPDNINEFKQINSKFKEFGDTVLLIENPNEFLNRIVRELDKKKIKHRIGLVNYYNPFSKIGSLSVYDKKEEHSYQNEFRIWINYEEDKPTTITIGSIKDFTRIYRLDDLLK